MTEPTVGARRVTPGATPGDSRVRPAAVVPPMTDVRRSFARLLLQRSSVITVVLGLSVLLLLRGEAPARAAVWLQSSIIAATYLSSVIFGVLLRQGFSPKRVARPMLANDLVLTSALVYITGGAQSPYA